MFSSINCLLCPHKNNSPFVGLSMVPIKFNSVVLPPPEVPNTTTNSPRLIVRLTPLCMKKKKEFLKIFFFFSENSK